MRTICIHLFIEELQDHKFEPNPNGMDNISNIATVMPKQISNIQIK